MERSKTGVMKRKTARSKPDRKTTVFIALLCVMAVYYGWRMFALTPWYDELYTYYYFISRGPVYAAIHWPLPNNHVGYSVLSAVLDWFGNPAVGLRGVSYLASLGSLALLYRIGRECFPAGYALLPPALFAAMNLVNQMAVQGRGYALAAFLCLAAFWALRQLVVSGVHGRRYYVLFGLSIVWALYTLPSSIYFVLPLCVTGGLVLLCGRRFGELGRLIAASLVSALCTLGLYALIWLAIGSNLLSKTADGPFYAAGHIEIILHAPLTAMKTGIDYMLASPYIQSVARSGYLSRLGVYIRQLFDYYCGGGAWLLAVLSVLGVILLVYRIAARRGGIMEWYLFISFVMTPLMLIAQCALPYYRVFSYFGAVVALMCTWLIVQAVSCPRGERAERIRRYAPAVCSAVGFILLAKALFLPFENTPYGLRETAVEEAYRTVDITCYDKIAVTDCDQQYLLKYLYGLDMDNDPAGRLTTQIEEADCVLLDRRLLVPEQTAAALDSLADDWKFYLTRQAVPYAYLEEEMQAVYENEGFVFYARR